MNGFIYLHRKMLENPIICKDTEHIAVWVYLLLNATHKGYDVIFESERIKLKPGQLITGRKSISSKLNINESKVQRILKTFEIEQQIEQQTTPRNRLISILNWSMYQNNEQQIEQQLNNKRTTTEQQLNTNNNVNKVNNENNKDMCIEIIDYLNLKTKKAFRYNAKKTLSCIDARLNENYTLEDFKKVIDNKTNQWIDTDKDIYLRPETLFGNKFEGYLNEKTEDKPKPLTTYKTKGSEEIVW